MKNVFIDKISSFVDLSPSDIDIIMSNIEPRHFRRGEYFLKEGQISQHIGFVVSGVFRFFRFSKEGEELTQHFYKEGCLIAEFDSFYNLKPSCGYIQAETEATILVASKDSLSELRKEVEAWEFVAKRLSQESLVHQLNIQRSMIDKDASSAYLHFIQEYPTIALRVPAKHLASYMGITKHSLSRIRKKIAKNSEINI